MRHRASGLLFAVLTSTACSGFRVATKPRGELRDPGYFDVGVGFATIFNTSDGDDNDSRGILASFKGYPFGRWYANKAITTKVKESRLAAVDDLTRPYGDAVFASAVGPGTSRPLDYTENPDEDDFGESDFNDWYAVEGKEWNRFSVFYGMSVGNFSGGDLDSLVHTIGVGYDITPELALIAGWAFFDVEDSITGRSDTDNSFLIGVSLNLNAFKGLLQTASSQF